MTLDGVASSPTRLTFIDLVTRDTHYRSENTRWVDAYKTLLKIQLCCRPSYLGPKEIEVARVLRAAER